jgi:hypothetical protein
MTDFTMSDQDWQTRALAAEAKLAQLERCKKGRHGDSPRVEYEKDGFRYFREDCVVCGQLGGGMGFASHQEADRYYDAREKEEEAADVDCDECDDTGVCPHCNDGY